MTILWSLFVFFITLSILVTVHEFGHFWVARCFGVGIERFSVGFGRALYAYQDKKGCDWVLAWIPLGGYVKMQTLDPNKPKAAQPHAFENQSLIKRTLIVLAGPVFNWLLAILAYALMFFIGIAHPIPIVGKVLPNTPAATANIPLHSEIVKIGTQATPTWRAVMMALLSHLGSEQPVMLRLRPKRNEPETQLTLLNLSQLKLTRQDNNILRLVGLVPYLPMIKPIIAAVQAHSGAALAGLKPGDKIIELNHHAIKNWQHLKEIVASSHGRALSITVERQQQRLHLEIVPEPKLLDGKVHYYLGIVSKPIHWPKSLLRDVQAPLPLAFMRGISQTYHLTTLTYMMIYKIITGHVMFNQISGPVGIAEQAGMEARIGFVYYLSFLGLISISMAVLNLLPIPLLDGGQLLYLLCEWIRGRPLSEQVRAIGLQVGGIIILSLLVFALYNDLTRIFFG